MPMPAVARATLLKAARARLEASDNPVTLRKAQLAIDVFGYGFAKSTLSIKNTKPNQPGNNETRRIKREIREAALRDWVYEQEDTFSADDVEVWMHVNGFEQQRRQTLKDMLKLEKEGIVENIIMGQKKLSYRVNLPR